MIRILTATIGCLLAGSALAQDAAPAWSYEGKDGPEHWAELSSAYEACSGKHQSPIDVVPTEDIDLPAITFAYAPGDATVMHKGHVVQADVPDGSSITIDDHTYMLKQFHFHAPGETRIGGVSYPLEAHLVHADAEGKLAVVAVPYSIGPNNPGLAAIWPKLPQKAGDSTPLPALSPESLLPPSRDYYHYEGSLTTPPCTEGVQWLVMKHAQTATTGQISRFVTLLPHANSRPTQAANGRKIEE